MNRPLRSSKNQGNRASAVFAVLALIAASLGPLYRYSTMPAETSYKVKRSVSQWVRAEETFGLSVLTRESVDSSGGCPGGPCRGGILQTFPPENFHDYKVLSKLPVPPKGTSYVWLQGIEPKSVIRENKFLGEDSLIIRGNIKKASRIYFAAVPTEMVGSNFKAIKVQSSSPYKYE